MPAYKNQLSPEERWAVIAYQHTFSGHTGAHVPAEHREIRMAGGRMHGGAEQPAHEAGRAGTDAHAQAAPPAGGMPGMAGHGAATQPATREPGMAGMGMHGASEQPRIEHPSHRGAVPSVWTTRDHRWQPRGPWLWAVPRELPQLFTEFNGIDFGHAHLAETLIRTQDPERVERARLEVLDFIFSSPRVPPDEDQVAPTLVRMVWETQRAFNWAHLFHRTLYDLFASDKVQDKEAAYRKILADYLAKPEAITSHRLDHHGKLWSFRESKAFRDKFPKFNVQIWSYHWLQAATYDVQLMGNAAKQRELIPKLVAHYHGYLRNPPVEWQFMPMLPEGAPEFTRRFPEAAAIFDNLHMLHDNMDDILSRPDLYPTLQARRETILKILSISLHRNHAPEDRWTAFIGPRLGSLTRLSPSPGKTAGVLAERDVRGLPDAFTQRTPSPALISTVCGLLASRVTVTLACDPLNLRLSVISGAVWFAGSPGPAPALATCGAPSANAHRCLSCIIWSSILWWQHHRSEPSSFGLERVVPLHLRGRQRAAGHRTVEPEEAGVHSDVVEVPDDDGEGGQHGLVEVLDGTLNWETGRPVAPWRTLRR